MCLAEISPGACQDAAEAQFVPLHEEVSELMANTEARRLRAAQVVHKDASARSGPVGQKGRLAAIERGQPDFPDVKRAGDLRDGDRAIQLAELAVNVPCQDRGVMDVGKVDAVEVQQVSPPAAVGSAC